ncbi:MAG: 4-hydroxybenzoate--CoA ligase [Acidiphilium sp. 21-60-14]|nr:MAG: 4-hydroxybenzoate--CoA ligase [Acidiphilium sp. 21-60-14]OYV89329.1 MAG: 4-hydroxybenzoate--CoA ligase [Acidiphilium sp. 37-60-79]
MGNGPMSNDNAVDYFIDRHVRDGRGGCVAFIDDTRRVTYQALLERSALFAGALRRAGIRREARVALIMLDAIEFPVAFWGALRAGVVPVPVNTMLPPEQVRYILEDCRAEAVLVSAPLLEGLGAMLGALAGLVRVIVVGAAGRADGFDEFVAGAETFGEPVGVSADEIGFFLYSSGSTSAPKGVRHRHGSLRATAETFGAQVLAVRPDDVVFSAAKLFFAYGLGNAMIFPMAVGACAVLSVERASAAHVVAVMRRERPTLFCGVPTLYAAMVHAGLEAGAGSDRLRVCTSAGEALPAHIGAAWRAATGVDILDGVGSTEMLHIFLSNRLGSVRYGHSGVAVPGYALRLVDEAGAEIEGPGLGELWVRGPSMAEGYWNQTAKSRATFIGEWMVTGDKYTRDAEGIYTYCGRSDDLFKVSGIWVSPFEVETALGAHPAVLEAAVIGTEDDDGLVKPQAFVVLAEGFGGDLAERERMVAMLQEHVKQTIGHWKYPRWVEIVEALPKTATGKIQRYKLRKGWRG